MQPAWQIAKQWHEKYVPERPFSDAVVHFLREGLLHSSPEIFLCAKEVHWDGKAVAMNKEANAWFIYMAAGTPLREIMSKLTQKDYVLWCRRNDSRVRAFDWEQLAGKVGL